MKSIVRLYWVLFGSAAASASIIDRKDLQAERPDKKTVTIATTSYSGTGCPAGSVATILSEDRTVVTFGFDKFQAIIGPKAKPADASKNCAIKLGVNYPKDFQLSIVRATYHGYVRLDDGVSANFFSNYFWSGKGNAAQALSATVTFSLYHRLVGLGLISKIGEFEP